MLIRIKSSDINDDLKGLMNLSFNFMDKILKINNFVILKDSILVPACTSDMTDWFKLHKDNRFVGIRLPKLLFETPSGDPFLDFFEIIIKDKRLKLRFEKRFCK